MSSSTGQDDRCAITQLSGCTHHDRYQPSVVIAATEYISYRSGAFFRREDFTSGRIVNTKGMAPSLRRAPASPLPPPHISGKRRSQFGQFVSLLSTAVESLRRSLSKDAQPRHVRHQIISANYDCVCWAFPAGGRQKFVYCCSTPISNWKKPPKFGLGRGAWVQLQNSDLNQALHAHRYRW